MGQKTLEDIRKLMEQRAKETPTTKLFSPKRKTKTKHLLLEPRLTTLLRLWCFRNRGLFTIKELQIFPGDKLETLYIQVHNWVKSGYLEKNGYLYEVTPAMKQKLEGMYNFMKDHQHGQGAERIQDENND